MGGVYHNELTEFEFVLDLGEPELYLQGLSIRVSLAIRKQKRVYNERSSVVLHNQFEASFSCLRPFTWG